MSAFEFIWFKHGTGDYRKLMLALPVTNRPGRYRVWWESNQTHGMEEAGVRRITSNYKDVDQLVRRADVEDHQELESLAALLSEQTNHSHETIRDAVVAALKRRPAVAKH